MIEILKRIIESSVVELEKKQPDILISTEQTTMTEWNLGHHYANELSKYIFWLNNDIDVVKRNYNNRRPDIIFHKRKLNCLNLLVLEIKILDEINTEDFNKIKNDWMQHPLNYQYGACISFNRNGIHVGKLFTKEIIIDLDFNQTNCIIPTKDKELKKEIIEIVENIKQDKNDSQVKILTKKIHYFYGT